MMYYTDASSSQLLFQTCGGNRYPGVFKHLPADNDVALPPNPALEEQASDPNAPHVHVHMPGDVHEDHAEEKEEKPEPEPEVPPVGTNKQTGNRGHYGGDSFADRLYNEVMARRGGSTKGGAGSGRNLLNNYYTDYTDYGYRPYKDYSNDYDYNYDVGNQRSRYRNRIGNQRNGGNYGGRTSNAAHAFFGFDNDDDNAAWGWQQPSQQQQSRRPAQQKNNNAAAVMGGPPSPQQSNNNHGREGSESASNLHVQNPNNQFLPRQRAGARQRPVQPASPIKQQTVSVTNTQQKNEQNTKQPPPQTPKKGGASPTPSKL